MGTTGTIEMLGELLRGQTVAEVVQHRPNEVLIQFADGSRLFVEAKTALEFSVTAGDIRATPRNSVGSAPSERQLEYARGLGIDPEGKSARVLSAEIQDQLEAAAQATILERGIRKGVKVRYLGSRTDLPPNLVVSTVSKNGFVYFKRTAKYCRPWNVERE
jgi:hypothetical protein